MMKKRYMAEESAPRLRPIGARTDEPEAYDRDRPVAAAFIHAIHLINERKTK
jgi:hypothetical protein